MEKVVLENLEDYGFQNGNDLMESATDWYIKMLKNIYKNFKCNSFFDIIKNIDFDSDWELYKLDSKIKERLGQDFYQTITNNIRVKKTLEEMNNLKRAWDKFLATKVNEKSEDIYDIYDLIKKNPLKVVKYFRKNENLQNFKELLNNFTGKQNKKTKKVTLNDLDVPVLDEVKDTKKMQNNPNNISIEEAYEPAKEKTITKNKISLFASKVKEKMTIKKDKIIDMTKKKVEVLKAKKIKTKLNIKKTLIAVGIAALGVVTSVGVKQKMEEYNGEKELIRDDLLIKDGNDSFVNVSKFTEEDKTNNDIVKIKEEPKKEEVKEETQEIQTVEELKTGNVTDNNEIENTEDIDYTFVTETDEFTLDDDALIYGRASDIGTKEVGYTPKYKDMAKTIYKIVFDLNGEMVSVSKDDMDKCLEVYKSGGKVVGVAAINEASKNADGTYTIEGYYGIDDIVNINNGETLKLTK